MTIFCLFVTKKRKKLETQQKIEIKAAEKIYVRERFFKNNSSKQPCSTYSHGNIFKRKEFLCYLQNGKRKE